MNSIPLEDIKLGMSAIYSQTITDTDIKSFSGISGDRNPVHLDANYAAKSRYKKRIAYGLMMASYISALFGINIFTTGEAEIYVQ